MISIPSKSYLQLKIFGRRSVLLTIRCKMFCWNLQNLPVSKSLDSREYLPIPGFNESMTYRVEICRDRRDRLSCKICASCVNFPGKQCDFSQNLRRITRFTLQV